MEFNVAVINTTEGGGGLKIYIAKAEGKLKAEEISHIKFEVESEVKASINYFEDFSPNINQNPAL